MKKKTWSFSLVCCFIFAMALPSRTFGQDYVPGEVMVKLRAPHPSSGLNKVASFSAKASSFMDRSAGRVALKGAFLHMGMMHVQGQVGQETQDLVNELSQDPDVEYVEPNWIVRLQQSGGGSVSAWTHTPGVYEQSTNNAQVTEAWGAMTAGAGAVPVVAIVDTGIDPTHPVFSQAGAIWTNPNEIPSNGIDDDNNGFIDDVNGWNFLAGNNNPYDDNKHGTHVAGIILGVTQDILVSPITAAAKIKIMPLKFLDSTGTGSTSAAVAAIYYAARNGAKILNNSWGGPTYSQSLHDALAFAYSQDVFLSAAAGNSSTSNDFVPMYPTNLPVPSQLSVAAMDTNDTLAYFSDFGPTTVTIGAPGVYVNSTIPGGSFQHLDGTSMASPFIAGVAALVRREAPNLSSYQVKNVILNSANALSTLVGKVSGTFRVNALQAVNSAKQSTGIMFYKPLYVANAPAGTMSLSSQQGGGSTGGTTGCATVTSALSSAGSGGGSGGAAAMALTLTLLPLLAWMVLKARSAKSYERRHDRFVLNSEITLNVAGRELRGQMNTISAGGLGFKADSMLEKGGIITIQIASPDGQEQIQVQGRIVWNENNQSYGVEFAEARDGVLDRIKDWTSRLARVS